MDYILDEYSDKHFFCLFVYIGNLTAKKSEYKKALSRMFVNNLKDKHFER